MSTNRLLQTSFEFNTTNILRRLFEVLPATLSWSTLIGLSLLSFIVPLWIAIFVIVYDVYVLIRAAYMSIHLIYAYRRLAKMRSINWLRRCQNVSGDINQYITTITKRLDSNPTWADHQLLQDLRQIKQDRVTVLPWDNIHHIVILPTYDESLTVLRTSLTALAKSDFPLSHLHVVVGFEARIGDSAKRKAAALTAEFS